MLCFNFRIFLLINYNAPNPAISTDIWPWNTEKRFLPVNKEGKNPTFLIKFQYIRGRIEPNW